jgi:hypothetical protein
MAEVAIYRRVTTQLRCKILMKPMCNNSIIDFSWTAHQLEQTSGFNPLSAVTN